MFIYDLIIHLPSRFPLSRYVKLDEYCRTYFTYLHPARTIPGISFCMRRVILTQDNQLDGR